MEKVIWFTLSTIIFSGLFCTLSSLPVKADNSISKQTQTYTVQIPSEISFDSSSDNKSLHISGHVSMNKWFEINVSSSNQFSLVYELGTGKIPYTISKDSFYYNPQFIDRNDYDFSEDIDISLNETDSRFAGSYKDTLTFTFTPLDTRTIILDCNGGSNNDKVVVKHTVRDGSAYRSGIASS